MQLLQHAQGWFSRHPLVRDAVLWSIPAIIFGFVLRAMLMSYSPFAYWGSDSGSYFNDAYRFVSEGKVGLEAKRRYLYPLFMVPIAALPGSPLKWTALVQHTLGLVGLIPLTYAVRKVFLCWRFLIIPVTLFFAGMPVVIWFEHELIGETLFFSAILWACAGWCGWTLEKDRHPERARQLWWWFLVPFAIALLTKPAGRFYLPGIILGLVAARAWRVLKIRHVMPLLFVILLGAGMGTEEQSSWLLYSAAFPLTRLDTPLHAEYKAEIRDLVQQSREHIGSYYANDYSGFLRRLQDQTDRPLWRELADDKKRKAQIFNELSKEAIMARPDLLLFISFQRLLDCINPSTFKNERFAATTYASRWEDLYNEMVAKKRDPLLKQLFGISQNAPTPSFEEISKTVSPKPDAKAAQWLQGYAVWFGRTFDFLRKPKTSDPTHRGIETFRIEPLGYWLIIGFVISLIAPRYRLSLGILAVTALSYLLGVFCAGVPSARYFGGAWPMLVLVLAVPADVVLSLIQRFSKKSA